MSANQKRESGMAEASTASAMARSMRVNGKTTCVTARALKRGPIIVSTPDNGRKMRSMGRVLSSGQVSNEANKVKRGK